ncbi:MAG: MATE family efflux transporter [Gemmatimonadota bacterium]
MSTPSDSNSAGPLSLPSPEALELGAMVPAGQPRGSLTDGPLGRTLLRVAIPAVGTTLLQVLFNITDTFWVGRTLGPTALAGVSVASYALWIIITSGELISVGLGAIAARRHGEGRPDLAAHAAGTALWMAVALGIVVPVVGMFGLNPLLHLMGTSAEVAGASRQFLIVQLLGAFLIYGYMVVDAAFRSAGDTRTPFLLLAIAVLFNLVMDPVMILGLGPFPKLGVYGAGLATVLTRGGGCLVGLWLLFRRRRITLAFEGRTALTMFRIGIPAAVAGFLFSFIYVLLVPVISRFGSPALAALGIGHKVEGMGYMTAVGFGLGAEAVVGQNLGAGRPDRARRAGWLAAGYALAVTLVMTTGFLLIPDLIAGLFTTDQATIADAALYLVAAAVAQPAIAFEETLYSSLSGAGYTLWPMVWVVVLCAIRVPLAVVIAPRWGLAGIWLLLAGTAMLRGVVMTALWQWGSWETARA